VLMDQATSWARVEPDPECMLSTSAPHGALTGYQARRFRQEWFALGEEWSCYPAYRVYCRSHRPIAGSQTRQRSWASLAGASNPDTYVDVLCQAMRQETPQHDSRS
jgi:hypothetical protein